MNKLLLNAFVLLSLSCSSTLVGDIVSLAIVDECAVKARIAAFFPTSNRFRQIYDHTLPSYQLEATARFHNRTSIWVNVDWVGKNGNSDHLSYFTSIKMLTYSAGLSLTFPLNEQVNFYVGLGPCGAYTQIHNRHVDRRRNQTKNSIGFLAKSGVTYNIDCHLFVDFFVDYFYQPNQFTTDVDLGGTKTGIGVGYQF